MRHISYELDSNYCQAEKGKKFIIYASTKYYKNSPIFPYINLTYPSREIINNNFIVGESLLENEIGKNELELLLKYKRGDTISKESFFQDEVFDSSFSNLNQMILFQAKEIKKKNKTITIVTIITGILTLLLILVFFKRKV